jgi:hypothetical protein
MTNIRSEQERARTERERGWIILLLYHARPRSVEFAQLRKLLDTRNLPLSSRKLAEHIEYLCEYRLVRVEVAGQMVENGALHRALQRYADSDVDGLRESMSLRLTAAGVNLQEGVGASIEGIAQID